MSRELEDIEPGDGADGCGFSWDHTPRLMGEADGIKSYECTECGAEIVEEPVGHDVGDGEELYLYVLKEPSNV